MTTLYYLWAQIQKYLESLEVTTFQEDLKPAWN